MMKLQFQSVSRDRSGSWTLPAPAGAYSQLPAWTSAEAWFDAVLDALATPEGEECRRCAKVSRDTLLRVAYADRKAADQATGRGVATAHETVAAQLGMSAKTVQRARRLLERLGLAVTVIEGRYLTAAERAEATARHGGRQVRAASTRALILPREAAAADRRPVENVHLPSSRRVQSSFPVRDQSPTRARTRTREATASRRPAETKRKSPIRSTKPRPLAVQKLAAELARRMPWLVRDGRHIGHLSETLDRHRIAQRGWTSQQILDRIDAHNRASATRSVDPASQRDPLGYFVWMLRRAIGSDDLSPTFDAAERRAQRIEAARRAAAARAERRAQLDAEADQIDSIIAAMHQQFPRRRHTSRIRR